MSSFYIKPPLLVSDYAFKRKVHTDDNLQIADGQTSTFATMRMLNGISQRVWSGTRDDDRIGHVVDFRRLEFHWDVYSGQQGGDQSNDQVLPTVVRHSVVWLNETATTEDVITLQNEVFDIVTSLDIHTPFNADNLSAGDLIPIYDKTFTIAPILLANKTIGVGVPPETEYFYTTYVPLGKTPVLQVEEGIIDLAKYYYNGLRSIYGSGNAHDIKTGIIIDIWRTENNLDKIFIHGKYLIWYNDK